MNIPRSNFKSLCHRRLSKRRQAISEGLGDAIRTAANHRLLRTVGDLAPLKAFFDLGVNYGESGLVNRHRIEAFVLYRAGRIVHAVTRQRREESRLLEAVLSWSA